MDDDVLDPGTFLFVKGFQLTPITFVCECACVCLCSSIKFKKVKINKRKYIRGVG